MLVIFRHGFLRADASKNGHSRPTSNAEAGKEERDTGMPERGDHDFQNTLKNHFA